MSKYLIRRLGWSLLVLFGLSIIIFCISRIVPGDPARIALGSTATEEAVERLREEMHLNDPLPMQYFYWLTAAIQGDFGISLMTKRPVVEDIKDFAPNTIELILLAAVFQISVGIVLGITGAKYNSKWPDMLIRLFSYAGIATPAFVMAVLFLLVFGFWIPLLPEIGGRISSSVSVAYITGFVSLDALLSGNLPAFAASIRHIVFPALALAIGNLAQESRITRSSMIDNSNKDYISMMTAQGVPSSLITRKYLFRPSIIPTVSIMALDFSSAFSNAFLVETIFSYPGLSRYGITAMLRNDLNAICAVVLILGLIFVVANILVDIIISFLDPRISLGSAKGGE